MKHLLINFIFVIDINFISLLQNFDINLINNCIFIVINYFDNYNHDLQ
jgi:hypothetical protein